MVPSSPRAAAAGPLSSSQGLWRCPPHTHTSRTARDVATQRTAAQPRGPLRIVRLYAYRRICQYTNVPTQYFAATPVSLVTWMALGAGPSSIASDRILTLGLLPILVRAGYGEAISGKNEPHWKVWVCDPRNARIAEQFIECDSTGHEGIEVISVAIECKALARYQGFSENVLGDGFVWRRVGDVALQDLHEQAFGPGELRDRLAGEFLAARERIRIAPVAVRGRIVINVESSSGS